ncbi:MAG: hypothetical protein ACR2P2_18900 [Nakamurella sp.]
MTRSRPHSAPARPKTAVDRAYDKRRRRTQRISALTADPRLVRVGLPIREAMAKIPFVIVIIGLLAVGGFGVLYLNTRTDEAGIRATESQQASDDLKLRIESLQRDIAAMDATSEIARKAQEMGLVQVGDPAIIVVPSKGAATVIGTPMPAPTPVSAAQTNAARTNAAQTSAARTSVARTNVARTSAPQTTVAQPPAGTVKGSSHAAGTTTHKASTATHSTAAHSTAAHTTATTTAGR